MSRRTSPPWNGPRCRYCTPNTSKPPAVVIRDVALPPDHHRKVWRIRSVAVDRWPHPDGDVVRDPNGTWRRLDDVADALPGQPRFRIHSAEACAGISTAVAR